MNLILYAFSSTDSYSDKRLHHWYIMVDDEEGDEANEQLTKPFTINEII